MLTNREKIFVSMATIAVLGILTYYIYGWLGPIGPGLENPKTRASTLSKLIKRNAIKDLPKYFSYKNKENVIQYFTTKDRNGNEYHLVAVTYEIAMLGDRTYSFVFDSDWKCLLESKDRPRIDNGFMLDYTRDGYVEKILSYNIAEKDGNIDETVDYDEVLQVWRLQTPSPELLLDIRYKSYIENVDSPGYIIPMTERDRQIELLSPTHETLVSLSWSQEKEQFICNGPLESKNWKIVSCPQE